LSDSANDSVEAFRSGGDCSGNTAKKSDVTDPINVSVEVTIPVIARKSEDLADRLKKEEKVVGNTDPKMDILLQRRSEPHSDLQWVACSLTGVVLFLAKFWRKAIFYV